ncbi:MAG TPA: hypothetical protein VMH39_12820 [Gemmatimonadaceae bacterium]|nr:hypothetical protein [Gemmatimonadaceae bacterium]
MRIHQLTTRALPLAAALLMGAAARGHAQGTLLYTFTGVVDRDVQITMHRAQLSTDNAGLNTAGSSHLRLMTPLPAEEGALAVVLDAGRGTADVVQQPNATNDYTGIVRIRDKSSGADTYRASVYWSGLSGGEVITNPGRPAPFSSDIGMLHWTGNVDGTIDLIIRGNTISYHTLGGKSTSNAMSTFKGDPLPRAVSHVHVELNSGRGTVGVAQQPNAENGYTAIVRIWDPQPGYGFYDFNVHWF